MTPLDPRLAISRTLGLAVSRVGCTDPEALTDARDLVARALFEIEGLRLPHVDPVSVALARLVKGEGA